jgi:hypothetical protein
MRNLIAALGLLAAALIAGTPATAQTQPEWTTILDASKFAEWGQLGESNWRVEDGVIVADKNAGKTPGFLVTKASYKDFALRVEFWSSDDANSGVFIRCSDARTITDRNSYEVNIFDRRPDPTYGTGGIVHYAEVNPMPKAAGRWNTMEITAKGRHITVMLNGQKTSELHNGLFTEGPIGLQHGAGTIKFRKIELRPL